MRYEYYAHITLRVAQSKLMLLDVRDALRMFELIKKNRHEEKFTYIAAEFQEEASDLLRKVRQGHPHIYEELQEFRKSGDYDYSYTPEWHELFEKHFHYTVINCSRSFEFCWSHRYYQRGDYFKST